MCCMVVLVDRLMMMILEDGKGIGVGACECGFASEYMSGRTTWTLKLKYGVKVFFLDGARALHAMGAATNAGVGACEIW